MKLVYQATGKEVKVGDIATTFRGEKAKVLGMTEPHKPSSTGRVYVEEKDGFKREFYPSVIDAEWV